MAHLPVGAGDMVEQCEQHAYSVLGYRIPIAFGCVVNGDVTRCQIVHINLIQTRSCPSYKSELSSFFQQGTVHGSLGSNNQSDRKSTRLNSSHVKISYAVFCLKKKK